LDIDTEKVVGPSAAVMGHRRPYIQPFTMALK